MKSKIIYIALFAATFIYTSCSKISESIQRDIIVKDSVLFDIPILSTTTTYTTIPTIETSLNLEKAIGDQVEGFTTDNVVSVKITSLNMGLGYVMDTDSIDKENNFGNLETVKFEIAAGGKADTLAKASIPSAGLSSSLTITPVILPERLKPYLTNTSSQNYNVIVKAKKATTTIMKVKAWTVYAVTLSK